MRGIGWGLRGKTPGMGVVRLGKGSSILPRILDTSPLALWDISETSGTVAHNLTGNQVNLVSNPNFATAGAGGADVFANWTEQLSAGGTIADEIIDVHSPATHAAKVITGAGGNDAVIGTFEVAPGVTYPVEFWTKADGVRPTRYTLYDLTHGALISPLYGSTGISSTNWTRFSTAFVAPAGCRQVQLYLYSGDLQNSLGYFSEVIVSGSFDGAISNVTLGQPGVDGRPCGLFNGTTSYIDLYTPALNKAFNRSEFSSLIFYKPANAGTWTDGTLRVCLELRTNGNNAHHIAKNTVNNQIQMVYIGGGVTRDVNINGLTSTDWMALGFTASVSGDTVRGFINGVQQGLDIHGLTPWTGVLDRYTNIIGAYNNSPLLQTSGWLQYAVLWDRPIMPEEVASIYRT